MAETIHGVIPYIGAFAEAGDVDLTRIVLSVLPEGLPTRTAKDMNVVIEQIHIYPRQVSILALGPFTNIAFKKSLYKIVS
jgi:inosine-uridine nucleoside N-ribohydrolase